MSNRNVNGLSRDIPEKVKREVRQRDGFGCILCGNAIIEYEHFDPSFNDAFEHKASGITILCGQCHNKRTRGVLSLETIRKGVANPRCRQTGFSFEAFDIGDRDPVVLIGTLSFKSVRVLIRVLGDDVFSIKPPEVSGSPFLLSAKIADSNGKVIFEIDDNEWKTSSANWDVELSGRRIIIRKGAGDIALVIRSDPPARLVVERINMLHKGTLISGQEGRDLRIKSFNGTEMIAQGAFSNGCQIGVDIGPFSLSVGVGGGTLIIDSMTIGSPPQKSSLSFPAGASPKTKRNSPCWCGSRLRFKKCHGRLSQP